MFLNFRRFCTRNSIENITSYSKINRLCTVCSNPKIAKLPQPPAHILLNQVNLLICRHKSQGKKINQNKQASESESDEEPDDNFLEDLPDKNTKTLKVNVTSMRLDAIIKAGLGLSRNKIEPTFYESKIRLNGEKVMKKSTHVNVGDEIDIIKGVNVHNPDFLTVARVEVLSATPNEESIRVKLRRCKSLTIENNKGRDSWQS